MSPIERGLPEVPLVRMRQWMASRSCSPSSGRSASLIVESGSPMHERRLRALELGVELGGASRGFSGWATAPSFIRAWRRMTYSAPRLRRWRPFAAAAHSLRGEPARGPRRLGLELLVGEPDAAGDQRHAVGAGLRALGEPVVEDHLVKPP